MNLRQLRDHAERTIQEFENHLRELDERGIQHFTREGEGPLSDVTQRIRNEYQRHIETYAGLIAQIDGLLGT